MNEWQTEPPDFTKWGFHVVPKVEYRFKRGGTGIGPYQGYGLFGYGFTNNPEWGVTVDAWRPIASENSARGEPT